ncbi:MAG TPA: 3-phosphoglycerate dehydrogenase [Candidatus Poseidoniales archaeon]|nr:MAG TPA: 3-phosphoglycerate dehydrogenase [Candidatus Poseidoniales archaeon]
MHMARIAVTDGMSDEAVEILENAGHEVVLRHHEPEEIANGSLLGFDAVVIRSATKLPSEQISASVNDSAGIRFIGRAGVGVDNIDIAEATKIGITVCNTPGASTRSVVELTIGHLIASTRHITTADRTLRNGKWAKKQLRGSEIGGKRLGLIGFGRIARGVASIASSFGMEVHAFDPFVDEAPEGVQLHGDVDEIFRYCTHISVHCNLNEQTRNLVNSERISMMPGIGLDGIECGNHIVSCARGGVVDESAASMALESGQLTSLALDVFEVEPLAESDLLRHDSFHGSPHIAASTLEAQARIGTEMAGLLIEYFETGRCHNSLN